MATSIIDRLTQAIRVASQAMQSAQYQADYRNWHEVHRVLQDARDELSKPYHQLAPAFEPADAALEAMAQPIKRGPGRPRKEQPEA